MRSSSQLFKPNDEKIDYTVDIYVSRYYSSYSTPFLIVENEPRDTFKITVKNSKGFSICKNAGAASSLQDRCDKLVKTIKEIFPTKLDETKRISSFNMHNDSKSILLQTKDISVAEMKKHVAECLNDLITNDTAFLQAYHTYNDDLTHKRHLSCNIL